MPITISNIKSQKPLWLSLNDLVEGTSNPSGDDVTVDANGFVTSLPNGPANRPLGYLWANIKNICTLLENSHTDDGLHTGKLNPSDLNVNNSPLDGQLLSYNATTQQFNWIDINQTDEKVKTNSTDPISGYLEDKIDGNTLAIDNYKVKVKDNVFALVSHTHTPDQVGLGNVTNDPQLKRGQADFVTFTQKSAISEDDILILEDSQDSYAKKFAKVSDILATTSDYRLKNNIKLLSYGLEDINKLKPVSFTYVYNNDKLHFGLIAQDTKGIIPEIIEKGEDDYLKIRYQELIPILINAIQELKEQVDNLTNIIIHS